jgi:hypothetical protein
MGLSARLHALAGALVLAVAGCGDGTVDPRHPGADLGTFRVDATREANTCGDAALGGAPATWSFELRLRRGDSALYWDNGVEIIPGVLGADGQSFSFDTGIVVDMRAQGSAGLPPCSVARRDRASGTLDAEDDAFKGSLSYDFAPTQGSACEDLVTSEMPSFGALPCSMKYALDAERSVAPAP